MKKLSTTVLAGAVIAATVGAAGAVSYASGLPTLPSRAVVPVPPTSVVTNPDNIFVPVQACRVVDTRKARGKIKKISPRNFQVAGTTNLASQGGSTTGCNIPTRATAISARFTAVNVTKKGAFTAFPRGTSTHVGSIFYNKHKVSTTGVTQAVTTGPGKGLTVASSGKANLVIDVTGYYEPRIAASIASNGVLGNHSNEVLTSARGGGNPTGVYVVTFSQDVTGCVLNVSPQTTGYVLVTGVLNGTTATLVGRNPGNGNLADTPVALTVTC